MLKLAYPTEITSEIKLTDSEYIEHITLFERNNHMGQPGLDLKNRWAQKGINREMWQRWETIGVEKTPKVLTTKVFIDFLLRHVIYC